MIGVVARDSGLFNFKQFRIISGGTPLRLFHLGMLHHYVISKNVSHSLGKFTLQAGSPSRPD